MALNLGEADDANILLMRGSSKIEIQNTSDDFSDFNRAIKVCNPDEHKTLGEIYFKRGYLWGIEGNHEKAAEDFTKAIFYDSNNAPTFMSRAITYSNLEDWIGAVSDYSRAV